MIDAESAKTLTFWKELISAAQSLVTIIAICGGAIWYFKRRRPFPRAKITHQIADKILADNKVLIRLVVTVLNQGEVLLSLEKGFAGVQQVNPCPQGLIDSIKGGCDIVAERKTEAAWDTLAERAITLTADARELEPGEEEEFNFDFLIDGGVKTVIIYSYFENRRKKRRAVGWNKTTIYDLSSSC